MHLSQSELFRCLKTFSKAEGSQFHHWLSTETSKKAGHAKRLYSFLHSSEKDWQNEQFDLSHCHEAVFPDKSFQAQRMRDLMTLLYAYAKDFMVWQELKEDQAAQNKLLLQQFRKRGLDKAHQIHLTKWKNHLDRSSLRDHDWFYQRFVAEQAEEAIVEERNIRRPNDLLQETTDALDVYFVSRKLQALCEMQNRSRIFRRSYDFHLRKEIESALKEDSNPHLNVACITIYHRILQTFDEPEKEEHYRQLLLDISENKQHFSREEARSLYRYAENYCIRKINQGQGKWLAELLVIFEQLIDTELILQKGQFPHTDFKNIVTVGLRLGKNDWVLDFIQHNQLKIEENIRANAYNYNLANYYYETKNFDAVVDLLQQVEFSDLFYELSSKYILIKVYYDLDEHYLLSYLLTSFGRFVSRNKAMSSTNRASVLSFLSLTKKLSRYQQDHAVRNNDKNRRQIEKIEAEIAKGKPTTQLNWIQSQLNQLTAQLK